MFIYSAILTYLAHTFTLITSFRHAKGEPRVSGGAGQTRRTGAENQELYW